MLSRKVTPVVIYLLTAYLNFWDSTPSLPLSPEILRRLKPLIYLPFLEISPENPAVFTTHLHFYYRVNPTFQDNQFPPYI